jgi:hypothetical protein
MKLSFLGQVYDASSPVIDGIETKGTVTFLGKVAKTKAYNLPHRQSSGQELSFMGRPYVR